MNPLYQLSVTLSTLAMTMMFAGGTAFADRVNNGGHGALCGDDLVSLDLHEAQRRGLTISLGEPDLPYLAKVDLALDRLAVVDPDRAGHYRQRREFLFGVTSFSEEESLSLINDLGAFDLDEACSLVQLVQRTTDAKGVRLVVVEETWDILDDDNRAALVLHEIIYDEAIERYGHANSEAARRFNGLLMSTDFDMLSPAAYREFLVENGLLGH